MRKASPIFDPDKQQRLAVKADNAGIESRAHGVRKVACVENRVYLIASKQFHGQPPSLRFCRVTLANAAVRDIGICA